MRPQTIQCAIANWKALPEIESVNYLPCNVAQVVLSVFG